MTLTQTAFVRRACSKSNGNFSFALWFNNVVRWIFILFTEGYLFVILINKNAPFPFDYDFGYSERCLSWRFFLDHFSRFNISACGNLERFLPVAKKMCFFWSKYSKSYCWWCGIWSDMKYDTIMIYVSTETNENRFEIQQCVGTSNHTRKFCVYATNRKCESHVQVATNVRFIICVLKIFL